MAKHLDYQGQTGIEQRIHLFVEEKTNRSQKSRSQIGWKWRVLKAARAFRQHRCHLHQGRRREQQPPVPETTESCSTRLVPSPGGREPRARNARCSHPDPSL